MSIITINSALCVPCSHFFVLAMVRFFLNRHKEGCPRPSLMRHHTTVVGTFGNRCRNCWRQDRLSKYPARSFWQREKSTTVKLARQLRVGGKRSGDLTRVIAERNHLRCLAWPHAPRRNNPDGGRAISRRIRLPERQNYFQCESCTWRTSLIAPMMRGK